ncbi:MAG: hypothetical protein HY701_10920 [Gemmatimonadetes bacterium]|nr:hypothetical protein [Gemmatimonadota bacterium]
MDTMCVGGASIIVLLPLLLTRQQGILATDVVAHPWLDPVKSWLAVLINVPHFMASYRMVYRSRETILKHKWASMYVPGFLAVYSAYAIWVAQYNEVWIALLAVISGAYLAWHYTGQAWGMMATYAHLAGTAFDRTEMHLIRGGLRILLAWHVTWFFYWGSETPLLRGLFTPVYSVLTQATFLAIGLGVWGFVRHARRAGRLPPIRTLVPWAAIFIWYAAMATHPAAQFWVQIAHALQYLGFPLRVEINRAARRPGTSPRRLRVHVIVFGLALVGLSFLFLEFVPPLTGGAVEGFLGSRAGAAAMMVPNFFLNIHHYFTDGAVWKLRNPEVRADLFGHLSR